MVGEFCTIFDINTDNIHCFIKSLSPWTLKIVVNSEKILTRMHLFKEAVSELYLPQY